MCEYCEIDKAKEVEWSNGDIFIQSYTRNDFNDDQKYYRSDGEMGDPIMVLNPKSKKIVSVFDDCIESMAYIKFCPFCGRKLEVET